MDKLMIVKAEKKDIPFIFACIKGLADYIGQADKVTANEGMLEKTIFGSCDFAESFIAYIDSMPAGYILIYKTYSTFSAMPGFFIEDLYILPEFRNRGIGKSLFEFLVRYSRDLGYAKIEWHVKNDNFNAIGFYYKLNAKKLDSKSVFYLDL